MRFCAGVEDASRLSSDVTLSNLGLDSLMATEIRQRHFDISLSADEIRELTFAEIDQLSAGNAAPAVEEVDNASTAMDN